MYTPTQTHLDTRIDSFLEAKLAKYPDIEHASSAKPKGKIEGVLGNVSKIFHRING